MVGKEARTAAQCRSRVFGALFVVATLFVQGAAAQDSEAFARYREGAQALAEHRYDDAQAALREAVRLDPEFAGAWLDLALATYAAGDLPQAEELLDTLEARFSVPPPLAALIADLRRQIRARAAPVAAADVWRWRRRLALALGRDSNANAGLAHSELTLTLPSGALALPLTRGAQARADYFGQAALSVAAVRPFASGVLELTGSLDGRRNARETDFDAVELRGGIALASATPLPVDGFWGALPGPWRLRANVEQLTLGGKALTERLVFGAEHQWSAVACRPQAGIEFEWRRYPVAHTLDASYLWLSSALRCPVPLGPAAHDLALQLRLGEARARNRSDAASARPGGDSHHLELTAVQEWTWARGAGNHTLQALAQGERVSDTDGYSPLLHSNEPRTVDRTTLGLTWTLPLPVGADRGWRAVIGAQQVRQSANLQPFDLSGRIVQFGIERQW